MKNKIKIVYNSENKKIAYLLLNDKYDWVGVPSTSKLSRAEYTNISIEDNAKQILDYITSVYGLNGTTG